MPFIDYCTESEQGNGSECISYLPHGHMADWELQLWPLPRVSREPVASLERDQNSKNGFYWMCIAFSPSESQKIISQSILSQGLHVSYIQGLAGITKQKGSHCCCCCCQAFRNASGLLKHLQFPPPSPLRPLGQIIKLPFQWESGGQAQD